MVIQRIQTLFLLLSTIMLGLFCNSTIYIISPTEYIKVWQDAYYFYPAILSAILSFVSIFLYKQYKVQRNLVSLSGVISAVLLVCNLFGQFSGSETMGYAAPCLLSVSVVLNFLAVRGINHDARLIADSNRIR